MDSDTVSVIDGEDDTKINDIPVGKSPSYFAINENTNTIYVINDLSKGISVIDGVSHKVVAGAIFSVNLANSGKIVCDNTLIPIDQYLYVWDKSYCTAVPNNGFEFINWNKKLANNSTMPIKNTLDFHNSENSNTNSTFWDLFSYLIGTKKDIPNATFSVTEFGSYIANFKEIPPPIPKEYLFTIFGVLATTIVGISLPGILRWIKSIIELRKLNRYYKQIDVVYDDGKLD
jgi:YVTN family beta-propeller protein